MLPLNLSVEAHLTALVTVDDSAQLLALAGRPVEPLHDGIQTFEDGEILFPVDDFIIHAEALPAAAGGGRCGMEKNTETTLRRITVSNDAVVVWRDRRVLAAPIVVSSSCMRFACTSFMCTTYYMNEYHMYEYHEHKRAQCAGGRELSSQKYFKSIPNKYCGPLSIGRLMASFIAHLDPAHSLFPKLNPDIYLTTSQGQDGSTKVDDLQLQLQSIVKLRGEIQKEIVAQQIKYDSIQSLLEAGRRFKNFHNPTSTPCPSQGNESTVWCSAFQCFRRGGEGISLEIVCSTIGVGPGGRQRTGFLSLAGTSNLSLSNRAEISLRPASKPWCSISDSNALLLERNMRREVYVRS
ncbi:hypothetical protein FOZ60_014872 [Perkinsus olseni]|uniref:Uncharacterized protein n=1 Tax=Perkinsus olseni TaxID=32597 RepID=A0A7J6N6X2_PEROL|nr:hypothetical protein FOZ60_014872 [Perkinsus olseni]